MTASRPIEILYAEDDEGQAYLVRKNLEQAGITNPITHVVDGQLALDFVNRRGEFAGREVKGPLVLILDINMPRVDGIEVLTEIRADKQFAELPVIMLTTSENPREIQRCYRAGCNAYVTKPFGYNEFAETVKRLGLFLQVLQVPCCAGSLA